MQGCEQIKTKPAHGHICEHLTHFPQATSFPVIQPWIHLKSGWMLTDRINFKKKSVYDVGGCMWGVQMPHRCEVKGLTWDQSFHSILSDEGSLRCLLLCPGAFWIFLSFLATHLTFGASGWQTTCSIHFMWVLVVQTLVFTLVWQALLPQTHLLTPELIYFVATS